MILQGSSDVGMFGYILFRQVIKHNVTMEVLHSGDLVVHCELRKHLFEKQKIAVCVTNLVEYVLTGVE